MPPLSHRQDDAWGADESAEAGGGANAWDDEEEEAADEKPNVEGAKPKNQAKAAAAKNRPKKLTKAAQKKKDAEFAAREAERMKAAMKKGPMSASEAASEKAKLQKLVEEADNELTNDLFGVLDQTSQAKGESQDDALVAAIFGKLSLVDVAAYTQAGEQLAKRLLLEKSSVKALTFVKDLMRGLAPDMSGDQIQDLIKLLNVLKNTKTKKELGKKKKKKGKKQLKMSGRDDLFHGMDAGGNYAAEDYDDGDFM